MNEIIRKRKSTRKYNTEKLDTATLESVKVQIADLVPLYPNIKYSVEIVEKTKSFIGGVSAPHYLLFGSEEKDGYLENIGFVGQQLDLFFSEAGLGSCWLGLSKPHEKEASLLPFVICMSFGKPLESPHRNVSDFKRKPLSEMSDGTDERLEAARLAPSGANAQNWFFVADNGKIHCYCKKLNFITGLMFNKMSYIDLGIALCHIYKESDTFHYQKETTPPEKNGYIYMGTVT
ncbi:MAG: nitroreductase [Defluviitaleaceae bacterium]|nr:nitroreductase [Defluviitaleaceae bacterium]